jgi:hypothetical protein
MLFVGNGELTARIVASTAICACPSSLSSKKTSDFVSLQSKRHESKQALNRLSKTWVRSIISASPISISGMKMVQGSSFFMNSSEIQNTP